MSAERQAKDQAMAARMKNLGIVRDTMRCPVCHSVVRIATFPSHLGTQRCR